MGCGPGAARDEEREEAEREYQKMLDNLTLYQKNLIVSSAWLVVRVFEKPSSLTEQGAAIMVLKQHLEKHTR